MCKARSAKFSRHMNQSSGLNILGTVKMPAPGFE